MELSISEENYLKALYKLSQDGSGRVSTNDMARSLNTAAASVTDMIQKLSDKDLVEYEKYKGCQLSPTGRNEAMGLIRKHRLWEVFLHNKLGFGWEEVHDYAEQLEHVRGNELIEKLDHYLGFPKFDPHGDPIPNANGNFTIRNQMALSRMAPGDHGIVVGVKEHGTEFLQLLENLGLTLGKQLQVISLQEYDQSMEVQIDKGATRAISSAIAQNLYIKPA
jgi:DtxR family Mn-dependent transcriptional regulator